MPLPYPLPPSPQPKPGTPPGPYDVPDAPGQPAPRRTALVHPQHQEVPLVLGASAMYYGMLSWRPENPVSPSRLSGPVLPVLFR